MINFIDKLKTSLKPYSLLTHPFYQKWSEGSLSQAVLKKYAQEYYHHVAAFPRYISSIHTLCDTLHYRQILLKNLVEEEAGEKNHPELWKRFFEGLGGNRLELESPEKEPFTQELVNGYFDICKENFSSGLGALYAYERQTPEVSSSKIGGLKKFYGIEDPKTLEFFTVHQEADEWHTEECEFILKKLNSAQQQEAEKGASEGAKLLWRFLDGMNLVN